MTFPQTDSLLKYKSNFPQHFSAFQKRLTALTLSKSKVFDHHRLGLKQPTFSLPL